MEELNEVPLKQRTTSPDKIVENIQKLQVGEKNGEEKLDDRQTEQEQGD